MNDRTNSANRFLIPAPLSLWNAPYATAGTSSPHTTYSKRRIPANLRVNASPPSRSRFRPAPMTPRGRMRRNCAMPSYFTVPHSAAGAFASPTKSNLWALLEVDGKDRLASSNMPQSPSVGLRAGAPDDVCPFRGFLPDVFGELLRRAADHIDALQSELLTQVRQRKRFADEEIANSMALATVPRKIV